MKEATGELNMTVITVVAIAAISLLFTMFVWPNIQSSIALNTACSNIDANGNYSTNSDGIGDDEDGAVSCSNFTCSAVYNGRTYSKGCNGSTSAAGGGAAT